MSDEIFPKWSEPATKGDLISVMSTVRSCIVDIFIVLRWLEYNNKEKIDEFIKKLDEDDDKLYRLIFEMGGGELPK